MYHLYNPYIWLLLFTAALYLMLTLAAWQRREAIGATPFTFFLLAAAIWPLGYALELAATELASKIFWAKVQYIGIASLPPLWMIFVLLYVRESQWLTRRNLYLLASGTLLTLVVVWTNELHGWFWRDPTLTEHGSLLLLESTSGEYSFFYLFWSYSLMLLGAALLVRQFIRSSYLYRGQIFALLLGISFPWLSNLSYWVGYTPLLGLNLTPFAFLFSSICVTWSLFQYRLLDIVPLAQDAVLESMNDGVLVLDANHRIVKLNPAAEHILRDNSNLIGKPIHKLFPSLNGLVEVAKREQSASREILLRYGKDEHSFDIRLLPLMINEQQLEGQLLVLHDITERKRGQAEREQLIVQLRDALFHVQTLYRSARSMIALDSLPAILQAVVDGVAEALGANVVTLVTINLEQHRITNFVKTGPGSDEIEAPSYADLAKGLTGWVVRQQKLCRISKYVPSGAEVLPLPARQESDIEKEGQNNQQGRHGETHNGAMMVAPLTYRGMILGALSATNRPDERNFEQRDEQLLMAMANQAAVAIANARLFHEVQRRAITDGLTGLHNRRHFLTLAEQEYNHAIRTMQPLSVIMFDFDHFKSFNDNYGHAIGDEVLRSIAKLTRQNVRASDIVGRYGGEEFAIILPNTKQTTAYDVAERLRQQIESTPVESTSGALAVTVSLGVAQMRAASKNVEQLLDEADMAMYRAKESGRNRVVIA